MRKLLFILLSFIYLSNPSMATNKSNIPDIDYPKTMAANAEAKLTEAIRNNDGANVVRNLIQSTVAKGLISSDDIQEHIERIDSVANVEKSPHYRALLYYFEAHTLNRFYSRNKYMIRDRISAPDSHDIHEWSTDQFESRIIELAKAATCQPATLAQMNIAALDSLVSYNEVSAIVYPTLFDMLAWNVINMIDSFDDKAASTLINRLIGDITTVHAGNMAPLINASVYNKPTDECLEIYRKYITDTDMAYLVIDAVTSLSEQEQYDIYKQFLERYPQSVFANDVKRLKSELEQRKVHVEFADRFSSSSPVEITCNVKNATDFTIYVFRLPDNVSGAYGYNGKWNDLPIKQYKTMHCDRTIPFADTVKIQLPALPYGRYIVYCDPDSKSGPTIYEKMKNVSRYSLQSFIVSDILLFSASTKENESKVFAVDSRTGKPLRGVSFAVTPGKHSFITDANGSVVLQKSALKDIRYDNCTVTASFGNDRLTSTSVYFGNNYVADGKQMHLFTDLAVYHPGDTVNFAAVLYSHTTSNRRNVIAGTKLKVTFSDSNFELIDTLECTTDEYGRIDGSFVVPRDRMNGSFHINVENVDDNNDEIGGKSVEVSDYKVPTFYIETSASDFYAKGKDVTITGKALSYTGMPIANSRLSARVLVQEWSWWWRFSSSKELVYSSEAETAADGSFSITIPADALNTEDVSYRFSQFVVDIDITSAAGETQSGSAIFRTGQFCSISLKGASDICFNAEKEIRLPIEVLSTDTVKDIECNYTLTDAARNVVASGTFMSSNPVLANVKHLASGKYTCTVTGPHDARLATDIVFFRTTDKLPPVESPLWIPECENRVDDNNRVSILLGNINTDSHIYCIAVCRNKVLHEGWMKLQPGLHRLTYDIPKDENEFIDLTFITVYGGETYRQHFHHTSKYRPDDISIVPVVFRDNLVPGVAERWSFKLVDARGNYVQGAMICEMMDNAINKIMQNDWNIDVSQMYSNVSWSSIMTSGNNSASFSKYLPAYKMLRNSIYCPELNTYRQMYSRRMRTMNNRLYMSRMESDSFEDDADGGMDFAENMKMSAVAFDEAPAPMPGTAGIVTESAESASDNLDNIAVRTADVQTALWRPSLRTDADGNIFVDFTSPQFATTWLLQAVAYTSDVHTARIVKEVLTSKPLMVRANMPRFVRHGDKVQIASTVTNTSDSVQHCTSLVEIFNIADNHIFASRKIDLNLAPHESEAVTIDWTVPDTLACVGYRIKAATAQFGDGEQHALVVLPAISPVVETVPFFIDASKKDFSLPLPQFAKGSRITLEYCDNPVWYCVTALPSLIDDNMICSTSIAHSLYAQFVAHGIALTSPDIREAIDFWNSNEADSTLVSNLAKNGELKINTLLASPWLREADRQTLRMHCISELFDDAASKLKVDKLTEKLASMQMSDGGFTWVKYDHCKSSFYSTHTILQLLGEVRRLGYIPAKSSIHAMLANAVTYYDATQLEMFIERKNKNDYSGLSDYVYTRSLYADIPMSAEMKKVHDKALEVMRTEWKGLNLPSKAYFALALHRNGDKVTPKHILRSLREYSITKPNTGMYWDNLQTGWNCFYSKTALTTAILSAFAEIEPQSADIDLIRKWVHLDKQANDWGNSSMASAAINAILSSGSKWLGKQNQARITIAGTPVPTGDADRFIGYFKRTLPVESASKALMSVSRDGQSPAWGALYCQYSAPITAIKAAKVDELSIEKEIYIVKDDRLEKADRAVRGDRLQVRFIIKNTRDLQYVTLHDERAACYEPVDRLSGYCWLDGTGFYKEIKNDATRLFFDYLPKGTHVISYDVHATAPGSYNVGVASIQSQYAPQIAAHSAGATITIADNNK